ncbi:MAG: phosphonate metabolism protein/1,5-bisphosphokinase (PRPP-forming) PhnN [Promethearchaeota archaeon]
MEESKKVKEACDAQLHVSGAILFLVVGNSGSGKDSLIRHVREHWPEGAPPLHVPKRVITRPPSPETENFQSATEEEFERMRDAGQFALWWRSYGHWYGVRRELLDWMDAGEPALVNVSRQIVGSTRERFGERVKVAFVRVPLEVTLERVRSRGRETGDDLEERARRAAQLPDMEDADFVVDNTGPLEEAGEALLAWVLRELDVQRRA